MGTTTFRPFLQCVIAFFREEGPSRAAALTCYFTMAVVPFCLLLVSLVGYFLGGNRDVYLFFLQRLVSFFPEGAQHLSEELRRVVAYREIGFISSLMYCLFSFQLFTSLESAVNAMFEVRGRRPLVLSLLFSVAIVTLLIVFLALSLGATSAVVVVRRSVEEVLGIHFGVVSRFFIRFVVPFALVGIVGTALYKLLPQRRVALRDAARGGFFFALLLEAAKHVFTLYVVNISRLGSVYGSLTAFVIFILWLYYSSSMFLIGAKYVHYRGRSAGRSKRSGSS